MSKVLSKDMCSIKLKCVDPSLRRRVNLSLQPACGITQPRLVLNFKLNSFQNNK